MEIFKTTFLMVGLMLLFVFVGYAVAGTGGMVIAFLMACGINLYSYFFSDKIVLKRYNAIMVDRNSASGLFEMVERLTQKANLPMPKVCIIPDKTPNAFATGRNPNNAVVAVTEGLLDLMNEKEVEAVLAHELSHVRHYDILTGSIAAVFAGAIAMLANFAQFGAMFGERDSNRSNPIVLLIIAIVVPIVASIIQMSISRSREFEADRGAALLTGSGKWLISALSKLDSYARGGHMLKNASESSAHMFIINPFSGVTKNFSSLFRTHPSTEDRIKALKEIDARLNG
ncbi:heat shock protein HtpX, M48 family peptidase [Campylobacter blaseri]|uniref:Protease HtpX homolog n=1 Tax=Campylobacter blaseri TaxID=2042961 RepID=A0A2P8R0U7_9BACT|nr:zinc metalloprotease HtpX [Campylobacter blaseri]PSM52120.1 protease [Campylobacter blaseri]PSM53886.1 protease [Campylobacter blaseri]QKF85320.1 heat shock protein HtpX, M48 family peptidase [Campylobacter blaseri]